MNDWRMSWNESVAAADDDLEEDDGVDDGVDAEIVGELVMLDNPFDFIN